jgi:hypothetical protein
MHARIDKVNIFNLCSFATIHHYNLKKFKKSQKIQLNNAVK